MKRTGIILAVVFFLSTAVAGAAATIVYIDESGKLFSPAGGDVTFTLLETHGGEQSWVGIAPISDTSVVTLLVGEDNRAEDWSFFGGGPDHLGTVGDEWWRAISEDAATGTFTFEANVEYTLLLENSSLPTVYSYIYLNPEEWDVPAVIENNDFDPDLLNGLPVNLRQPFIFWEGSCFGASNDNNSNLAKGNDVDYDDATFSISADVRFSVVPEPTAIFMLSLALLGGLVGSGRKLDGAVCKRE